MSQHRTRHSADFKAKTALVALSESKTLAEFASEYWVYPTQITRWKQDLIENASDLTGAGLSKDLTAWFGCVPLLYGVMHDTRFHKEGAWPIPDVQELLR